MNKKIIAMLVCAIFAATVIPSVSAAAVTLSTVDNADTYVMVSGNWTSDDVGEFIGLTLDEDDSLYLSFYNETQSLVAVTVSPYQDADEVVWFNLTLETAEYTMNNTWRQIWFSDEAITDIEDVDSAVYIDDTIDDSTNVYIVSIPDGVTFTYDDYGYTYDDGEFTVTDDEGDDAGNITSYNYSTNFSVYTMDLSDDDTSHQLVIVTDDIHSKATSAIGKRVTVHKWYWLDTTIPYTMSAESTSDYSIFTAPDGYLAFNVYNDYAGVLAKYIGGKTPFRMSENKLQYGTKSWTSLWLRTTWTTIPANECAIAGIKIGLIERIWVSEETGAEDNNEIVRENYGVVVSKGVSTTASGLDIMKMGTSRVPEAVIDTGKAIFA